MVVNIPTDGSSVALEPELVRSRINNFWGYGSLKTPVWFVGMEEGLDPATTAAELRARFEAANGQQTVDMRRDMQNVPDHIRWFKPNAPIQSTWKFLIALFLYLKLDRVPTVDEIREYQTVALGDIDRNETVGVELMPLPSNKANQNTWLYSDVAVAGLSTRSEYLKTYKPERVRKLAALIREYRPALVVFYSLTYLDDWRSIIGVDPERIAEGMYAAQVNGTLFCIIPQSASFGMSYKRLYEYADLLKSRFSIPKFYSSPVYQA